MKIEEFDSFEEAWERMDQLTREGLERATEEQKSIGYGDYWMRIVGYSPQEIFPIFGEIHTLEEIRETETELGAPEDEIESTINMLSHNYERGYRFGTAYSVITPEGEMGDTHVVNMWPISQEQFEEARELGWDLDRLMQTNWFPEKALHFVRHQQEGSDG